MIVDVHAHTPTHRFKVPAEDKSIFTTWRTDRPVVATNSWADFDAAMSAADVTIVFNIAVSDPATTTGIPHAPERTNDATAEFVANDPSRRIGFMSVDPTSTECLEEAERCRELGLVGVKFGPNYQNFDPLGEPALAFYSYCEKNALPIPFHQGASPIRSAPLRYTYPLVTDEVALRFPELRIVMAHMGHPWGKETVVTIRKHPHVYADVSSIYARGSVTSRCSQLSNGDARTSFCSGRTSRLPIPVRPLKGCAGSTRSSTELRCPACLQSSSSRSSTPTLSLRLA